MRIGILTMYYTNISHGGLLQAYSLCKALQDMGYDSEQIKYDYNVRFRKLSTIKKLKRIIKQIPYSALKMLVRDHSKEKYYEYMDEVPHSCYYEPNTIMDSAQKYDCFIVGSDQVWNMSYCDKNFFFPFVNNKKKIAYAASVGKDKLDQKEKEELLKSINGFHAVSVREKNLAEQITKANNKVGFVCDPVFLNDSNFWRRHAITPKIKERYVLVYILGADFEEKKLAYALAKKSGYKVITIPNVNLDMCLQDFLFDVSRVYNIGPREFLGLIDGAEHILTDSFHCTAFSIIFNKNFYAFSRPNKEFSMNSRIYSLLSETGLEERFIDLRNVEEITFSDIDYINPNRNISNFTKKSNEWLEEALR